MRERYDTPRARQHDLVVKAVGDEVLVYDLARHRAHSLNAVAAAVWRQCDGSRNSEALAAAVRQHDNLSVPVEAIHYALAELGRVHLLRAPIAAAQLTRRDLVKRLGTAAAVALPLVASIEVPRAASAQSAQACVPIGSICAPSGPGCCPTCQPPLIAACLSEAGAPSGECVCVDLGGN